MIRAAGAEFEAEVGFSGLNQLLLPLLEDLGRLAGPLRDALSVALGLREGPPQDRRVVADATLALLGQAADAGPLLLLVDDVQWLDRPSALVLGQAARRLAARRRLDRGPILEPARRFPGRRAVGVRGLLLPCWPVRP